jgi:hypothetical protein
MKRGTKSILFGVHQFLWHPFTIWRAWRHVYKENPSWVHLLCVFCHDLGYWGKPDMDGPEGQTHPEGGARIARRIAYWAFRLRGFPAHSAWNNAQVVHDICLCHSTHYAQAKGLSVSSLYLPDKACVLFDPPWFYLLRARLSGELTEYVDNANLKKESAWGKFNSPELWLNWYRSRIFLKVQQHFHQVELTRLKKGAAWGEPCECCICEWHKEHAK